MHPKQLIFNKKGLGTTFKASSFKIPHKAKSSNGENSDSSDEIKTPLSASSPIQSASTARVNTLVCSPSKSTSNQINNNNTSSSESKNSNLKSNIPNRPSSATPRNNASPKWHSGNMSPRYINSFESNPSSTSPSSVSPLQAPSATSLVQTSSTKT